MKAARFLGNSRIAVENVHLPDPADGEVRVKVAACALCGSDFRPLRQGWPLTPGHEIAGVVDHPGATTHGRRVLVYIPTFCGTCVQCKAGQTNLCAQAELIGWQRPGGYAQALNVPERCLLPIPDDIPDQLAPLLLDTVGTTAHGVRLATRVAEGGPALVIGAGPIGLGALLVLRRMGWAPLAVRELNAHRAEFAASLGAEPVSAEAAANASFSVVIEASGKDAGRQLALEAVAPGGAVVQLGEADVWKLNETRSIRRKDFFLIRSFYFPLSDYAQNIELLRADREDYMRLVDATAELNELEALFGAFARGERLKPLLCPA